MKNNKLLANVYNACVAIKNMNSKELGNFFVVTGGVCIVGDLFGNKVSSILNNIMANGYDLSCDKLSLTKHDEH